MQKSNKSLLEYTDKSIVLPVKYDVRIVAPKHVCYFLSKPESFVDELNGKLKLTINHMEVQIDNIKTHMFMQK